MRGIRIIISSYEKHALQSVSMKSHQIRGDSILTSSITGSIRTASFVAGSASKYVYVELSNSASKSCRKITACDESTRIKRNKGYNQLHRKLIVLQNIVNLRA